MALSSFPGFLAVHNINIGKVSENVQNPNTYPCRILTKQQNTLLPLPCLYIVYDFFYTILHWALHIKSIYGYIHKHHHVQKAPRCVAIVLRALSLWFRLFFCLTLEKLIAFFLIVEPTQTRLMSTLSSSFQESIITSQHFSYVVTCWGSRFISWEGFCFWRLVGYWLVSTTLDTMLSYLSLG